MLPVTHTEVLAREWLSPVALGRAAAVDEAVRRLGAPSPPSPPPWFVAIAGPSGAGTSTVARRAARATADRLRDRGHPVGPRCLAVRVAGRRGTHGVATALLQRFDDGFDGRGFPTAEVLAGFLRRVRREGRPLVLVLDDIEVGGPDLAPILRAFANPDRFLPEGESGLPPLFTLLAGSEPGLATLDAAVAGVAAVRPFLPLAPYSEPELSAIVRDRAERALGSPPPPTLVARVVRRAVEEGGGASRAIDLLRRELLPEAGPERAALAPGSVAIEARVVRALGVALARGTAGLGTVRRTEAAMALRQGLRPLPTTTLWRRLVRLERAGYLRREIRPGGTGGTRSVVRLLAPIDEWVTAPVPSETHRAGGPADVSGSSRADPGPAGSGPVAPSPSA